MDDGEIDPKRLVPASKAQDNLTEIPKAVIEAFSINKDNLRKLNGGQGTTWLSDETIIKPLDMKPEDARWVAGFVNDIEKCSSFRISKPVLARNGDWIADGWVAWKKVEGIEQSGSYEDKMLACEAYHQAVADVPRPAFLGKGDSPWAVADRAAWQEINFDIPSDFGLAQEILETYRPLDLSPQIVHGDISGNMLIADGLPPAIIDHTPYWRPAAFAKAVLVVDAIAWEGADPELFDLANDVNIDELVKRALVRRIIEQAEQVRQFGKDREAAVKCANGHQKVWDTVKQRKR